LFDPLVDELPDDVKADLAEEFRVLRLRFPPRLMPVPADAIFIRDYLS